MMASLIYENHESTIRSKEILFPLRTTFQDFFFFFRVGQIALKNNFSMRACISCKPPSFIVTKSSMVLWRKKAFMRMCTWVIIVCYDSKCPISRGSPFFVCKKQFVFILRLFMSLSFMKVKSELYIQRLYWKTYFNVFYINIMPDAKTQIKHAFSLCWINFRR